MSMKEPTPRTSRLALAGGALAVLAVGGAGFVAGRGSVAPAPAPSATVATAPLPEPVPSPATPARLDRAGLLAFASAAADATASGRPLASDTARVTGRRFSIALPFGCGGPLGDADATGTGWRYDAERGALRLQVASTRWAPQEWLGDAPPADIEAVEGFWVPRPWTGSEACPTAAAPAAAEGIEPVTLAGQSLAIGQMFRSGGARQDRRDGAPYVAVVRTAPDAVRAEKGFRVRLTGQLADVPGGAARCRQPGGPDQRPICLLTATFDEIAIENAATGETLARWPGGSSRGE
ncbi:hypothetical protein M9980_12740 [Sphingomonas donggukensis]|uniref:Uncharacterized protein n=1 Tax=Sphingomonas donggukensis TaxID=2949093 RepID=A0ABY4TSK5_9SPHN|nr:hypothetical protein [Sphingomonas donggukensis]URW75389.1 hypothetical protein M9980_12740 [Sphingomonas donggukensis]